MPIYVKFQTNKEVQDLAYDIVEKARDNGKVSKGANEVTKQVERGQAKLVVMANIMRRKKYSIYLCSK